MFKSKILEEIENIPEAQLPQLYEIIHDFRLNIDSDTTSPRIPGRLKGKLGETFFDPLTEQEAQEVIELSSEEADKIFSLIENPPAANDHLKSAIERHRAFFSEKD